MKNKQKQTNKNIKSEFAIGIIIIVALMIGGSILFENKNVQNFSDNINHQSTPEISNGLKLNTSDRILFLGDSITALEDWNQLFGVSNIINAGISGNTTDDVIARASLAISAKPKKLFLMIGINDLLRGGDVAHVFANYQIILKKIRLESPDTLIYIQSVLPINNDILKIETIDSQEIITLNDKLEKLADGKNIFFIELYSSFCGADNKMYRKYAGDGLHPSSVGYNVWKSIISQYVK